MFMRVILIIFYTLIIFLSGCITVTDNIEFICSEKTMSEVRLASVSAIENLGWRILKNNLILNLDVDEAYDVALAIKPRKNIGINTTRTKDSYEANISPKFVRRTYKYDGLIEKEMMKNDSILIYFEDASYLSDQGRPIRGRVYIENRGGEVSVNIKSVLPGQTINFGSNDKLLFELKLKILECLKMDS
jgi:hypothetical protein